MRTRPAWLTAICVVAICLGGMGFLTGLLGAASMAFGQQMQDAILKAKPAGQPQQNLELQLQMQREIRAVTDRWAGVNVSLLVVQFIVVGCLVIGGILALWLRPFGRKLLLAAFVLGIVLELLRVVPTIDIQQQTAKVMQRNMAKMMSSSMPPGRAMPPGARAMMRTSMKVGVYLGLAFGIGMMIAKAAFYASGLVYFRRPAIVALYADGAFAELQEPIFEPPGDAESTG